MNELPQPDPVEAALRELRYIRDDGFTSSVIAALPPRRKHRWWLRPLILGGLALAASVVALLVLPGGKFVSDCVLKLVWARTLGPSLILPALIMAGIFAASFAPLVAERD